MLGASPGASTSPAITLQVLEKCFTEEMTSDEWQKRLAEMVPAYKLDLAQDKDAYQELRSKATTRLGL